MPWLPGAEWGVGTDALPSHRRLVYDRLTAVRKDGQKRAVMTVADTIDRVFAAAPPDAAAIAGRLKEINNRGGEKISPREVDEVLLDHPAVARAVTFALPDPRLGEEVAAAIVLADGAEISERDLRDMAACRLAAFKVPRRIVFVDEIPKGATGKLQGIGLAKKLGLAS